MSLTKVTYAMIEQAPINPTDYGAVGDGIADDTAGFLLAVAAAKAANQPLDISNLKINLATQAASINSDDLIIRGNGYIETYIDYLYQEGGDYFDDHKTAALTKSGSVIFSRYNGPIFTGKSFSGSGFSIFCDMTEPLSSGFKQTTPTTYPGWSQGIRDLTGVYIANCGNSGIWLLGGLEVVTLSDIHTYQVNQWGLRVDKTIGVNSPIEYIWLQNSSFQWSLLNNIVLNGVDKHIYIQNCLLNAPQQLPRQTANGFAISIYADIIPCIFMSGASNFVGNFNINIIDNYAEQTNGLVTFNCTNPDRFQNVTIQGNTLFLDQTSADYFLAQFQSIVFDLFTYNNRINQGVLYYFPSSAQYASNQFINFADENSASGAAIVLGGAGDIYDNQLIPLQKWPSSGAVGDGTAGTFTYTIPTQRSVLINNSAIPSMYLISANFQSNSADTFGGYLMMVVRMPSNNYVGSTMAFGSVTGFSAPPTISTAGVISVPLDLFYRGRVSRIDNLALNPAYPVNFA
jgi:hypothetical protein